MPPKQNILIVCYAFPPFPGVGGRRWAKFTKYLLRNGHKVHVIAAKSPFAKKSEWLSDTKGADVTLLPLKYPRTLILFPTSLIGRVRYKFDLQCVKLRTRGNYYDKAVFWRNQLQEACRKIIHKEGVNTVIVSGAPFSLFTHLHPLKNEFPGVKFIADIRDPWTDNATSYAFDKISPSRLEFERREERTVFNHFDKVLLVNDHLFEYFRKLYNSSDSKFMVLPNGYDHEETEQKTDKNLTLGRDTINLAFTGTFYGNALYLFKALLNALHNDELNKLRFYFFGGGTEPLKKLVPEKFSERFVFGYYDDIRFVNSLIEGCDLTMLFLTDDINYSLSTKFCEYIKFKKRVVVFSKPGFTADFVVRNKIGYHIRESDMLNDMLSLVREHNKEPGFPESFNVEQFSVKNLTEQLVLAINPAQEK